MHHLDQRSMLVSAWRSRAAGLPDSLAKRRANEFFQVVALEKGDCWDKLSQEFLQKYPDAFDEVAPVLLGTDDPLVIYNCVRFADLDDPKAVEVLQDFIRKCDPEKHQVTLRSLVQSQKPGLVETVKNKKNLTKAVLTAIAKL